MLQPSFILSPDAPVFPNFSLPAKSIKFIIEIFSVFLPSIVSFYLKSIVIIVCALFLLKIYLEDVAFIKVAPTVRFLVPSSTFASIASYESTGCFDNPSTYIPYILCSLTFKPPYGLLLWGINKS